MSIEDKIIFTILDKLSSQLDERELNLLHSTLNIELHKVSIQERKNEISTELVDYKSVLDMFIATKRLEGLSPNSLKLYYYDLIKLLNNLGKNVHDITSGDIKSYMACYQMEHKITKVTLENMRSNYSSFFTWCFNNKYIDDNPMLRVKAIKQDIQIKKPYRDEEIELIRNYIEEESESKRVLHRAIVETLISTACRISEICSIDVKDVDFGDSSIIVRGKGSKYRKVYISAKAMYYLKAYLSNKKLNIDDPLFKNSRGKRLSKDSLTDYFKKMSDDLGFHVHSHRFRRTTATKALNAGMPPQELQKMLGHSNFDTTALYVTILDENVQMSHRKYIS